MGTTYLKDTYGNKLSFHGGIDIQSVLPNGTAEDIENEVKRRIAIYAPGGGFILCAAHNFQDDVPPENLIAMYQALNKWGNYLSSVYSVLSIMSSCTSLPNSTNLAL